jgi:hypothetical protein
MGDCSDGRSNHHEILNPNLCDYRRLHAAYMLNVENVAELVLEDLARITDAAFLARIHELLVDPYPVERAWSYGTPAKH